MYGAGGLSIRRRPVAFCALVAILLGRAVTMSARTIGPDAYGYTATDQVPFSFVDISTAGTRVLAGTDGSTYFTGLGLTFNLYGSNRMNASIATNGFVYLPPQGAGSTVYPDLTAD